MPGKSDAKTRAMQSEPPPRRRVVVVGGGIAGLYCALLLAKDGYSVKVLEATDAWGGRIETHRLNGPNADGPFSHPAEFGPMRFELDIEPLFKELLDLLQIKPSPFTPPLSPLYIPTGYPVGLGERCADGKPLSPLELLKLGVFRMVGFEPFVDKDKVKLRESEQKIFEKWGDDNQSEGDRFDTLRKKATLGKNTKLHDLGFWNALQTVLSPGAVWAINQFGSFYHLMPDNPNAVEWAIFWLRLFGPNSALSTVAEGVEAVVSKLVDLLTSAEYRNQVELLSGKQVTELLAGWNASQINVLFQDAAKCRGNYEADHVILALPRLPLQRLDAAFPDDIQNDLKSVMAFALVKVFAVMRTPDLWNIAPPQPHENAWRFQTREVHYFGSNSPNNTMMLLYTDHPCAAFWELYVQNPNDHHAAEVDKNEALKAVLWGQLKSLHLEWAEEQLRSSAGMAIKRESRRPYFWMINGPQDRVIRKTLAELVRFILETRLTEVAEQLASIPGQRLHSKEELAQMNGEELQELTKRLPGDGLRAELVDVRLKQLAVRIFDDPERFAGELFSSLGSCAIRDWARDSYIGAGCHAWVPGAKSWEVLGRLKAFGLRGSNAIHNLHICGEAYSDYQGFIEGALRSARDAVQAILANDGQ